MNTDICMGCFEPMNGFSVCSHCGWHEGAVPEHAYHLKPGTVLQGRYIIGNSVGVGGFGITYRAWDSNLSSLVAIKEFYPAGLVSRVPGETDIVVFSGDKNEQFDAAIARFLEEARTMAKFTGHPNIVNVFDFFQENNTAYIVMEFLDGITVKDYLATLPEGRLPVDTAVMIVDKILDALSEIHSKGVIHRDISPDNIDITTSNSIKIFDLGAAKLAKGDVEESRSIVVKTGYTPPEQYRAKSKQGPFTDLYSVGAVLYKLITGITPEESIDRIVEDHLEKPSKLGVEIDINLERAIMKALALKPELRFHSAEQFKDAISNKKMVDFPEDELRKRRKIRIAFASAIAAFTIAFGTYFGIYMTNFVKGVDYLVAQDDTISVCFPVSDDPATAASQTAVYQSIVDKFIQNAADDTEDGVGNKFEVQVTTVPASQYNAHMAAQKQAGTLPDLFSTDYFTDDLSGYAAELDPLLDSVSESEFVVKTQYETAYPSKREFPVGINANVIYANQEAARKAGIEIPSAIDDVAELFKTASVTNNISTVAVADDNFDDVLSAMADGGLCDAKTGKINASAEASFLTIGTAFSNQAFDYAAVVAAQAAPVVAAQAAPDAAAQTAPDAAAQAAPDAAAQAAPDAAAQAAPDAAAQAAPDAAAQAAPAVAAQVASEAPSAKFFANNLVYYIDDIAALESVRNGLPGYYQVLPLTQNGNLVVAATNHYGVSGTADENKQLVAMQLIRFLLTDYAQDLLHIQNKIAMPVNETTLSNYLNYNGDIAFVSDYTDKLKVTGESRHHATAFNNELYSNIVAGSKDYSQITGLINK